MEGVCLASLETLSVKRGGTQLTIGGSPESVNPRKGCLHLKKGLGEKNDPTEVSGEEHKGTYPGMPGLCLFPYALHSHQRTALPGIEDLRPWLCCILPFGNIPGGRCG